MNPKITITVDSKNKAISSFDGIASVGAKIDVEIRGLPSGIVNWGPGDDFTGPSVRLRIIDDDGNDVVRFPLEKKTSTKVIGGDTWTKTTVSGSDVYSNTTGSVVDFNTDLLREQFEDASYNESKTFGIVIDSIADDAEFAIGNIKISQWLEAGIDDPTVLPNWIEIQEKLNNANASVTKVCDTATISITNTHGVTTTATVTDGEDGSIVSVSPTGTSTNEVKYITIDGVEKKLAGGGDMNHSEFSGLTTLGDATLNQVKAKVNELICLLKPSSLFVALMSLPLFGDVVETTTFGDISPSVTVKQFVDAGGTNIVTNIVTKSYVEGLGITIGLSTNNVKDIIDVKIPNYSNVVSKAVGARQYNDLLYKNIVMSKFTWGVSGTSPWLRDVANIANEYDATNDVNKGIVQTHDGTWTANESVLPSEIPGSGTNVMFRFIHGEPNSIEFRTNGIVRIGLYYITGRIPPTTHVLYGEAKCGDYIVLSNDVYSAIEHVIPGNYYNVSNAAMRALTPEYPMSPEWNTNVSAVVTNDYPSTFTEWVPFDSAPTGTWKLVYGESYYPIGDNYWLYVDDELAPSAFYVAKYEDQEVAEYAGGDPSRVFPSKFTRHITGYTNVLGLAYLREISPIVSNTVTKAYVENLGISSAGYENYVWSYPNCWFINVTMSNRVDVTTTPTDTIVGFMVFSNDVEATTSGTDARCRAVLCDESSIETPSIKEWKSFTTGGSITSNGVFSADADGLYRVSAEDAVGKIRYVDIPIQSDVTTYSTNTYYTTDVAGTIRASVNGAALTLLQNATVVSTNWYEGTEYKVYSSFTPRMSAVGTGAGNVKCWAVSQHILSSAKHYAVKQLGANTFSDGVNSATVYRQEWVSLSDWAATNGFTAAEIAEAGIDDICLIRCAKSSAVPDGCIPYFMRSDKIESWFGGTLAGVQAWMSVQDHTEAIPTTYKWDGDYVLKDVKAQYCRMGTLYPVHSGDSGRCIFMMKDGSPIMLRQFGTAYEGPSFVNGFKIIKAFVENYGDTLKEAN